MSHNDVWDVVVVGGGQAGLSVGYHLARQGLRFVILEAGARVGDAWRRRWDSLKLFSAAKFDGLDGLPFPAPPDSFPTKDEMADYLEAYAQRFALPVHTNTRVSRLGSGPHGGFVLETNRGVFEARQVVVAMASYQGPRVPPFAAGLRSDIVQLHSSEYRNPAQLREGGVLLVGAGNSSAEIAMDLRTSHHVWMSGRAVGEVPFDMASFLGRWILGRLVFRVLFHRLLTVNTPMGRRARPHFITAGAPLIRTKSAHLEAVGVERVPRTTGVREGRPELEDGRVLDVANVIWCTGYDLGLQWIDLPVFDDHGEPRHTSGVVTAQPGLYFVGQHFLHSASSAMVHGVGRDARRVSGQVAARASSLAIAPTAERERQAAMA